MTEAQEIADTIWLNASMVERARIEDATEDEIIRLVREQMPNETWGVVHAVADSLQSIVQKESEEWEIL